jgi:hypothetical protein
MEIYLRYGKAFITYWTISPRGFPRRVVSPKAANLDRMDVLGLKLVSVEFVPVESQECSR